MKHSELMMFGFPEVTLKSAHICMHVSMQGTTLMLGWGWPMSGARTL